MSSSGKGQSTVAGPEGVDDAWEYAQEGGRAGGGKVIVEGFIDFDYEITLLTVRHRDGTSFCDGGRLPGVVAAPADVAGGTEPFTRCRPAGD